MPSLVELIKHDRVDDSSRFRNITNFLATNPEISTADAFTCLEYVAYNGQNDILRLLISHKLDVNASDDNGWTALHSLLRRSGRKAGLWNQETISILLDAGSDITSSRGWHNRNALQLAAAKGHAHAVRCILSHYPATAHVDNLHKYIERQSHQGHTALHLAAQHQDPATTIALLEYGANIDARDWSRRTALHLASRENNTAVVDALLQATPPSDVNLSMVNGRTALHLACEFGAMDVVKKLLERAKLNMYFKDRLGYTPLMTAGLKKHATQVFALFKSALPKAASNAAASQACSLYEASVVDIIDFGEDFHKITRHMESVQKVLYDAEETTGNFAVSTHVESRQPRNPSQDSRLKVRWIHLPVNNLEWVEVLLNKAMIDRGPFNIENYRHLFQNIDYQKESMTPHSRQMKSMHFYELSTTHGEQSRPDAFSVTYMPFLHFDSVDGQREMREAVSRETTPDVSISQPPPTRLDYLVQGYMKGSTKLQLRRTLDQFRYPGMNTVNRDQDQVVQRFYKHKEPKSNGWNETKLFVVEQLWAWTAPGIVITCSQDIDRDQLKGDSGGHGVIRRVVRDLRMRLVTTETEQELVAIIMNRCVGFFDRFYASCDDLKFFEIFELSFGKISEDASKLQEDFARDVSRVTQWLHHKSPSMTDPVTISTIDEPEAQTKLDANTKDDVDISFVNRLIDISRETQLHFECNDLKDELTSLGKVLEEQSKVVGEYEGTLPDIDREQDSRYTKVNDMRSLIEHDRKNIYRLHEQVDDVSKILDDLLNLKPRYATAIEARFTRDQAEDTKRQAEETARQGQIIMVFTIVTIIFLPMSFLSSFFAINIAAFPRDDNDFLPLGWVSKYLFGIGLGVSVPLILAAFLFGDTKTWTDRVKKLWERGPERATASSTTGQKPLEQKDNDNDLNGSWPLHRRATGKSMRNRVKVTDASHTNGNVV